MGFREFVLLVASVMAMNALSIDPMLPALPDIGADLHVTDANHRQWVITIYIFGMAVGALIYGFLSDRYGRRKVLLIAIALLLAATIGGALAPSFAVLLLCRGLAGFCAAACRVVSVSIVRDCFRGDEMAKVMSLIFVLFIIVPVLAPSFGQVILLIANWRWIFGALAILSAALWLWIALRLPETLDPDHRVEIGLADIGATFRVIVTHRTSMGYMIASGALMGGLMGFVISAQQIFFDIFHAPTVFPIAFAAIAGWMGVGSFFNSRLVGRIGARRLSQSALISMIGLSAIHSLIAWYHLETIWTFMVLQAVTMLSFAFAGSNFSSISMEPFARGAGSAASVQAFVTTLSSAVLGGAIGSMFNGTTLPLSLGFFVYGLASLAIIYWAERGKLFTRPRLQALRQENIAPPR